MLILAVISAFSVMASSDDSDETFVVVLDPGHGGKDIGAKGKLTNEKTINLRTAKRLKQLLEQLPGIKVVMTRDDDSFVSLQERADIANREKGNLFISLHVNSVARKARNRTTVKGASVYVLGLHRSSENLEVAMRENAVMSLEQDYSEKYCGFDPESSESYIIFELNQNAHLEQSLQFAQDAQKQLISVASRADRGVRQGGFWVLMATGMPAVLVETDFICNPTSEKFLHSKKGVESVAQALFKAFKQYHQSLSKEPERNAKK